MIAIVCLRMLLVSSLLIHLGGGLGFQKEHSLLGGFGALHNAWLKRCLVISVCAAWVLNTWRSLSRLGRHGHLLLIKSEFIQKLYVLFGFKANFDIVLLDTCCTYLRCDILQWLLSWNLSWKVIWTGNGYVFRPCSWSWVTIQLRLLLFEFFNLWSLNLSNLLLISGQEIWKRRASLALRVAIFNFSLIFLIWFTLIEFIRNLIFLLSWCSLNRWIIWTKFFSNIDIVWIHKVSFLFNELGKLI